MLQIFSRAAVDHVIHKLIETLYLMWNNDTNVVCIWSDSRGFFKDRYHRWQPSRLLWRSQKMFSEHNKDGLIKNKEEHALVSVKRASVYFISCKGWWWD